MSKWNLTYTNFVVPLTKSKELYVVVYWISKKPGATLKLMLQINLDHLFVVLLLVVCGFMAYARKKE
jgi:hypothetical protein